MPSFFDVAIVAMRSQHVVGLRLMKLAGGGLAAHEEAQLMVSEKVLAGAEAAFRFARGTPLDLVVSGYRNVVEANVQRLAANRSVGGPRSG